MPQLVPEPSEACELSIPSRSRSRVSLQELHLVTLSPAAGQYVGSAVEPGPSVEGAGRGSCYCGQRSGFGPPAGQYCALQSNVFLYHCGYKVLKPQTVRTSSASCGVAHAGSSPESSRNTAW